MKLLCAVQSVALIVLSLALLAGGDRPAPGPNPPEPKPNPVEPTQLNVLITYETDDSDKYAKWFTAVTNSPELDAEIAKRNGRKLVVDDDQTGGLLDETPWNKMIAEARDVPKPRIVIYTGVASKTTDLPETVEATIALIQELYP